MSRPDQLALSEQLSPSARAARSASSPGQEAPSGRPERLPRATLDEWVRLAQGGDRGAFADLVQAVAPILMRFFGLQGARPEEAEEAVQETLVRLYTGLASYGGRSDFRTYALGVARNVHLEGLRQRQASEVQDSDSITNREPLGALLQEEQHREVREALARLPLRMREALQYRFVEGMTCVEIAEALDTTLAAVSPLIYRAKRALRDELRGATEAPK